jgi:hypothetical protein
VINNILSRSYILCFYEKLCRYYFSVNLERGYFISTYVGQVTGEEIIDRYSIFFNSDDWTPGLNELVDHSQLDGSKLTKKSLLKVALFSKLFYEGRKISSVKTSIYAPKQLPDELSKMYRELVSDAPEQVAVFSVLEEAKAWLG